MTPSVEDVIERQAKAYGMHKSSTYRSRRQMLQRCYNPNSDSYKNYGGRGITVCAAWRESFRNFFDDMGQRPPGTSIDRIDSDGNYCPGNCRWATKKEQARNRRTNKCVNYFGQRMTLIEAAEASGLKAKTISGRIKSGWPESEWFSPLKRRARKHD